MYNKGDTTHIRLVKQIKKKRQPKEFASYQSCFTDTLRRSASNPHDYKWKQVPSNTLAEGDIIRLLKGDVAPTLIKRIQFRELS